MKLVRDNIPNIMRSKGLVPVVRVAKDEELESLLMAKLDEELKEIKEGKNPEEVADLIEVAFALGELFGKSEEQINELRKNKNNKNGSFKKKIVLED